MNPIPVTNVQPRILVVEDNKMNALLARITLEKGGCLVVVAVSGREGVERALTETFDVIFMDVQMPDLDGCEATREIRQFPAWRGRLPIIALTANVYPADCKECIDAGMDDCLGKPFTPGELIEKCELWINRRPLMVSKAGCQAESHRVNGLFELPLRKSCPRS